MRLRRRLPLIVFVLLVILALMLLGLACACLTEQPMQTIERLLSAVVAQLALIDVWSRQLAALVTAMALVVASTRATLPSRASPAVLQRFRF